MASFSIITWIRGSADNSPGGASSKKLTAFWSLVIITTPVIYVWTYWAYTHNDWSQLPNVLTALFGLTAAGLGLNMYEKIKGKSNETPTTDINSTPTAQ